jgi:hypothetical protein
LHPTPTAGILSQSSELEIVMANHFPARVGRIVVITSGVATLLCLGIGAFMHFKVAAEVAGAQWVALPVLALPFLSLPFLVRGYRVDGSTLWVERLLHSNRIDLRGLRSVDYRPRAFAGALRTFGNGGLFSFTGRYWSRELGSFRAFAMDTGPALMLHWDDRRVLLTPADPQALAVRLRQATGVAKDA